MTRPSRAGKKRRKAREWWLCCIHDLRLYSSHDEALSACEQYGQPYPIRVREVLPRARKGKSK